MDPRDKTSDTRPPHDKQPGAARPAGRIKAGVAEKRRKGSTGFPGRDDAGASAGAPPSERSEDFGGRRDIETADESTEQHDRHHHDRDREDAEAARPA